MASHKDVQSWRAGLGRELVCWGRGWLAIGQESGIWVVQAFVPALT